MLAVVMGQGAWTAARVARRPSRAAQAHRQTSAGWSLIELLVGLTVGLLLTAAATGWTLGTVRADSRLIAAARLSADLQTAAGLVAADLRRAGYRGDAASSALSVSPGASAVDPYSVVAPASAASDGVAYAYAGSAAANAAPSGSDSIGHRLRAGVLETSLGDGGWQALTDPAALRITAFTVEPVSTSVALDALCAAPCPASAADCPPTLVVRSLRITLVGRSVTDSSLVQGMATTTRLRNDTVSGGCPG